jgi:hypothetical protein
LKRIANTIQQDNDHPAFHTISPTFAEARGKAKAVLTAPQKKFKKVPKKIKGAVLAMSDSVVLVSLLEHAIDSNSLDEFAAALK